MATLNEIATEALDHLFITVGDESPDTGDLAKALASLQGAVSRLPEYGAGRKLKEVTTALSVTAKPDQRVICSVTGLTVTLPANPADGTRVSVVPLTGTITVTPTDRKLEGTVALQSITAATVWAYRADLADWVKLTALTGSSESPYPPECDSALGYVAALEAAPKFSVSIDEALGALIQDAKTFLRAKYSRPGEQDWHGNVPLSVQGPGRLRRYR